MPDVHFKSQNLSPSGSEIAIDEIRVNQVIGSSAISNSKRQSTDSDGLSAMQNGQGAAKRSKASKTLRDSNQCQPTHRDLL